jgi:hypothetical protein
VSGLRHFFQISKYGLRESLNLALESLEVDGDITTASVELLPRFNVTERCRLPRECTEMAFSLVSASSAPSPR